MYSNLQDKVVVISGASAGIGAACAHVFAQQGARLVLLGRRLEPLQIVAQQLQTQFPNVRCLLHTMDVNDLPAWGVLLERIKAEFSQVDIVVHNAGLHHRGPVSQITASNMTEMIQTNLTAPLYASHLFMNTFLEQAKVRTKSECAGMFIYMASLAGRTPIEGAATYSATKFALRAFSYALDEEFRTLSDQNPQMGFLRSCVVSPGPVSTGFILSVIDKVSPYTFSQKMATPEEVAEAVLRTAQDGRSERCTGGAFAPLLTHMGYLSPRLRRWLKPLMLRKGLRQREALRRSL